MPALRPGSFLDRLLQAGEVLLGREERAGAVPAPFMSAYGGYGGIPHPFKPFESLTYYGDNPWLFAAISLVAQEASRVKLRLYKKKKNTEDEVIEDHQALSTLRKPMPVKEGRSILTHTQFKQLLFKYILLNGEGFMLLDGRMKGKFGGAPTRLHPLMPAFVLEKLDENFEIRSYAYRSAGGEVELDPMDVIHFKDPDPKNWYRGHSPVQSARFALDSHMEADILNYYRMLNRGVPEVTLTSEQKISADEGRRVLDQWNQRYGGGRNAGKTALLPSGLKPTKLQDSNAEMQYAELKNLSKDEILANFRIPIEMLGKTDSQTRANAEASNYVFQRFTILPLIESFADTLTNDYLPAFPKTEDLYFGFEEFVPQDLEDKRKTIQMLFGIGGLTPNEGRAGFDLDPLEEPQADLSYLPFSVMPLAAQNPNPVIDDDIEEDLEGDAVDEEDGERQRRAPGDDEEDLPDDVEQFFDKKKESTLLAGVKAAFLLQGFRQGIDLANNVGAKPIPPEDVFTANVRKAIETKNLEKSAQAIDTTEEALRGVLAQAKADGAGVRELASRINDLYGESMGYRSLRIARTELTSVINDGSLRTYDEQGYTEKQWSTVMDGHERDAHGEANDQVVPIDQPFHVGGEEAMYPGDPNLSPELLINCRCISQPSGVPEDRRAKGNEMFLRIHGSLEGRFTNALTTEFDHQRQRVLTRLR